MKAIKDRAGALEQGLAAIRTQFQLPGPLPAEVEAAAAAAARMPFAGHMDRTCIPFVTLDPLSSTDLDQGIARSTINGQLVSNIVPLDTNGIAFSRSPGQVLNIVYLNKAAATLGGFFPAGVNGNLRASVAN